MRPVQIRRIARVITGHVLGIVVACLIPAAVSAQPTIGTIATLAGTGTAGFSGDASAATSAQLNAPASVVADAAENVYIADAGNFRVRRVDAVTGVISTVAGTGTAGFSGDGGPAINAQFQEIKSLAITGAGDLFVSDGSRVRKITAASGDIDTIAGGGATDPYMYAGPAINVNLSPAQITVDGAGDLFVLSGHVVYKVATATGDISTVQPFSLSVFVYGLAVDAEDGAVYVSTNRYISRWIGGQRTDFGNGGHHTRLAFDASGNLYMSDPYWVDLVDVTTGALQPVAGSAWADLGATSSPFGGDGGPATAAQLSRVLGFAFGPSGTMYIAEADNHRVRRVTPPTSTLELTTLAGTGVPGYTGEGTASVSALNFPSGVAVDASGNVFVSDSSNHRIRRVTPAGAMTTYGGTGTQGYVGDGGPATAARLNTPRGVAVDAAGNVYVADYANHRVRRIRASTGVISTIAGTGIAGFSGDGGVATNARLYHPAAVAVDAAGNVYIADQHNMRVRRVAAATNVITTIAGNGTPGTFGDGGPAVFAQLNYPQGVAVDGSGNVYIADTYNSRIRRINPAGTITTVAGRATPVGEAAFAGEGEPATSAALNYPCGVAVDAAGNVYIADTLNRRVRKLTIATGILRTIAGNGQLASSGDLWPATSGNLLFPRGVAVDAWGSVYVAEDGHRVRRVVAFAARPTHLTLRRYGPTGVILTWAATPGATSYIVKRGTTPSGQTVYASGITGTLAYIVGSINTRYYFKVSAVVAGVESPNSEEVAITLVTNAHRSDLDGDGRSDLVLYRPTANANWFTRSSRNGYAIGAGNWNFPWGALGDIPMPGDWDGDGRLDPTVGRPATNEAFILYSSRNYDPAQYGWIANVQLTTFGGPDGQPCVADFDADGRSDACIYRPATGSGQYAQGGWSIMLSSEQWAFNTRLTFTWGAPGDIPLAMDIDADGRADLGLYRPSTGQWFFRYSSLGYDPAQYGYFAWGSTGDMPLAADFDGDARGDVAVYRPATGQWFVLFSSTGYNPAQYGYFQWGAPGDQPKLGDFDGDGRTDVTVYRPTNGQWFIRYSSRGYDPVQYGYYAWGAIGDIALPTN